jgi:hypothetical protein
MYLVFSVFTSKPTSLLASLIKNKNKNLIIKHLNETLQHVSVRLGHPQSTVQLVKIATLYF